jgi:hypothetical protein
MEFRLLYEGELGANRSPEEKHAIRRSFHPQLRRLWNLNSNLRQFAEHKSIPVIVDRQNVLPTTEPQRFDLGIEAIGKHWQNAGFQLVPLVTQQFPVRCSLDILLLRPEEDRFIFTGGDIDARLKTLFDALRIPHNPGEVGGAVPQKDETPLFCLLEDDRLISEVRVTTDQLLLLPHERQVKANDAFAVIHVRLTHKTPGSFDQYFA